MQNIIDLLQERGFIDAMTSEEIRVCAENPMRVYLGFDPTADSLHVGNLMGIVALAWFQKCGHTPVVLLGGATGRIGDPSGKSVERPLLEEFAIQSNLLAIRKNFDSILDFSHPTAAPIFLNNGDWFKGYDLIDFLRDIGKHFRMGTMLAKESVRSRIESEEGMSFTEFSYQMIQAYDFYYLSQEYGVQLQLGGSDQWGNITAGTELIRKKGGKAAYGLTFPLLTRSDGKKFGKSEEGAVWLAPEKLSPYQFYQYFIRIPDADVIKLMRLLTFMELAQINEQELAMLHPTYIPNTAQKLLAEELTRMVHGEEGLRVAQRVTEGAAPGSKTVLDVEALREIQHDMPYVALSKDEIIGQKFVDLAVKIGFAASKGELVRLIQNGGAYLNNEKIEDAALRLEVSSLIGGEYLLFALGKKKKMLIKMIILD